MGIGVVHPVMGMVGCSPPFSLFSADWRIRFLGKGCGGREAGRPLDGDEDPVQLILPLLLPLLVAVLGRAQS